MFGGSSSPEAALMMNADLLGMGPIANMMMNTAASGFARWTGMHPGQFMPGQNIYDVNMSRRMAEEQKLAQGMAAQADRETYARMMRGMFAMSGRPITLGQERLVGQVSGWAAQAAPFAMNLLGPDLFDSLHGSRGSAQVMAQGIFRGGQLGQDTITGMTGFSGATAGAITAELQRRFFDPSSSISAFRGLSAGRVGMLYDELQMRGMAGPTLGAYSQSAQLDMLADRGFARDQLQALQKRSPEAFARIAGGGSIDDLTKTRDAARDAMERIRRDSPDQFDEIRRNFDARRIAGRLETLSGAVSAMRDIFGDMGKPNAPMRQIIEGLNQLTQGGLATMGGGQLEKSLRLTQALASSTGLGLTNMMGLMAQGAQFADRLGIERAFAVQGAQGAAAFGQAFGQVGRGDVAHWMARPQDEMTLLDQKLRMQAAKSGLANQLATTVRIVDDMGAGGRSPGGDVRALSEAIRSGRTTFKDSQGRERSVFMGEEEWRSLMTGGGVSPDMVMRYAAQSETNRSVTFKNGIADLARQAQSADIAELVQNAQFSSLSGVLQGTGMRQGAADQAARTASAAAAKALMGMDASVRRDDAARNRAVASAMRQSLQAQGVDVRKLTDADLIQAASLGFGEFNEMVKSHPGLAGYGSGLAAIEVNDPNTLRRQRQITQENVTTGEIRSMLAGIGRSGPLARVMDMLQSPPADLKQGIAKALGAVDPKIVTMTTHLAGLVQEYRKLASEPPPADPAARDARNAKLEALRREIAAVQQSPGDAKSLLAERMKARGLDAAGLDAALAGRGDVKLTDDEKTMFSSLRFASERGLSDEAAAAGIAVGARIGERDIAEVMGAGDRYSATLAQVQALEKRLGGGGTPEEKGELAKLRGELSRHGKAFASEGARIVGAILADETGKTGAALGAGALDKVRSIRTAQLDLQALADEKTGGDIGKLLASGDPEALRIKQQIDLGLGDLRERQRRADAGGAPAMGDEEKKALASYREELMQSSDQQNRTLVDRLIRETGGTEASVSEEERAALAKMLGSGESSDVARRRLERQLGASGKIDALAKARGVDATRLREVLGKGGGAKELAAAFGDRMSADDREALAGLGREAGSVLRAGSEGIGRAAYEASLADAAKHARQADDSGAKDKLQIAGTLVIKGLQEAILAGSATGPGAGDVPLAPPVT